jgi:hypothetical protein
MVALGVLSVTPLLRLICPPTKRRLPFASDATNDPVPAFGL